ncbi:MAG: T9SS type A sorting domain-containing protein [Bacteroidota bacterium]|nr:T9SS type A sorting domain-containing protein [Bacteroidota bacterium]
MIQLNTLNQAILFVPLFLINSTISAETFLGDPCTDNDVCVTSKLIANVASDSAYTCIISCNLNAAPDPSVAGCLMGDFPTVWFKLEADANAGVINIEVTSNDFESPAISVFKGNGDCTQLVQVPLTNGNLSCAIGSFGKVQAIGTAITPSSNYYIAVSSYLSIGGDFNLCVSTNKNGSVCVLDRNLQVTARSNGGPLEGPFTAGEKVSFCLNVNEYTAASNGCQWFQGIIPVFGNGWDISSFDGIGQPLKASLNGVENQDSMRGNYGASHWRWLDNVGYHHTNSRLVIGDFDNNGRVEMCNSVYEMDCPFSAGTLGGCCGPCWDNAGDILPAGWFAYGINGSCATPGPPIKVDWGDGNICGGVMGPWNFCFDLVTRSVPDCMGSDSSKRDLTLGFYTFADGEIGAWDGGQSVCALDQPVKVSFKTQCGRVTRMPFEELPDLCDGDIFNYQIAEDGIDFWEWNISPARMLPLDIYSGQNGFVIEGVVQNISSSSENITGILIGHVSGSEDIILRQFHFDAVNCHPYQNEPLYVDNDIPTPADPLHPGENVTGLQIKHRSTIRDEGSLRVYPVPADQQAIIEWNLPFAAPGEVSIFNSQGVQISSFNVNPKEINRWQLDLKDFHPGVYLVRYQSATHQYIARMARI